jgi:hypothetical protein
MENKHYCRVCGLYNDTPPWGLAGDIPTYEICPCCGVEFGNEDYTLNSIKKYREHWLNSGASWAEPKEKPKQWDLVLQMHNIPEEFR